MDHLEEGRYPDLGDVRVQLAVDEFPHFTIDHRVGQQMSARSIYNLRIQTCYASKFCRHDPLRKAKGRKSMIRKSVIAVISAAVLAPCPTAFAQQTGGTPDEAKSMPMKAVPAVKADGAKALEMFNKGEGRLPGPDLYVFCANLTDGKSAAIGNSNAKHGFGTDSRAARHFAVADGGRPRNQVIPSTEMSTL